MNEAVSEAVNETASEAVSDEPLPVREPLEGHVERIRLGHGANCSSVGSVVDTLFATAAVGAAIFAAVVAALKTEEIRIVNAPSTPKEDADKP